jgi:PAS domain S-box-containing protein
MVTYEAHRRVGYQERSPEVSLSGTSSVDYQKIFESLPSQYIIVTPDRTIVAATDSFLASTGKSRSAIIGMDILDAFPDNPDNPEAKGTEILRMSIERVVETGQIDILCPVRYDIANSDGVFEPRWFQPLNAPAFDDDGKLVYVLHGAEDITAQMMSKS